VSFGVARAVDFIGGGIRHRCGVERDDIAESAHGMSPRTAHRSGHEPLDSSGSLPPQEGCSFGVPAASVHTAYALEATVRKPRAASAPTVIEAAIIKWTRLMIEDSETQAHFVRAPSLPCKLDGPAAL